MAYSQSALRELYDQYGQDLFALCYLHAARPAQALDLMAAALCEAAASPKGWQLASSGKAGFFRLAYRLCAEGDRRRPRRRKKKKDAPLAQVSRALPFTLTDPLRGLLRLPLSQKAALFCGERLGLSPQEAAQVLGTSPLRAQRLGARGLKRAGVTRGQAAAALALPAPRQEDLERVWQEFLSQEGKGGFAALQRARRARRALDAAVPFLAAGAVALCVVAYLGVDQGWFGAPYEETQPIEGVVAASIYGGESQEEDPALAMLDVSVYVPEGDGYVEYIVHNTPGKLEEVVRQMVLLGGAPTGTTLLSADLDNHGYESTDGSTVTYTMGDTLTLTVELSEEAASLSGEDGERMLRAMTATLAGWSAAEPDQLSIRCQGRELTVNGRTAQGFLGGQLPITRTVETDYRE